MIDDPIETIQEFKNGFEIKSENERSCPECGLQSIFGMPGGRDAVCKNCGYKDPCCYD
jgi:DNA-directed RNA polymerase subunit RPC12/RpoP